MHKVKRSVLYFYLFVALLIHLTVLSRISIMGARPDVMLIVVTFAGLFSGPYMGVEIGFLAGFLKDIYALDIFWINTFVMAVTGLLAGILSTKFSHESRPAHIYMVLIFTIFSMWLHFLLDSFLLRSVTLRFWDYFWMAILPSSVYTSIIAIPLFAKGMAVYTPEQYEDLV